ncbi:MAG: tetratricopeptide repeat protein [Acidobacteriota bacterium]|nr:tetratricopeptide repeat protein [Acidobacteriota bacterium]
MFQLMLVLLALGAVMQETRTPEATSLLGKPLFAPSISVERTAVLKEDLAAAQAALEKDPGSTDAIIWVGRRTAYLGRYRDAIAVFTTGISKHPSDPRLLRHRGHRYISTRQFDKAIVDLTKAAALVKGRPDEVEPDGQPNAKNTPTSTLTTNIYYHLGLAHYLAGDFAKAADAYRLCMEHSKNADMQVATAHWQYMTLRRLGRKAEAAAVLVPVTADMAIIENESYHRLLMMYKGATDAATLLAASRAESLDAVTIGYGVANWHLYGGRKEEARTILTEITDKYRSTQWPGFGYVASEADLARLR